MRKTVGGRVAVAVEDNRGSACDPRSSDVRNERHTCRLEVGLGKFAIRWGLANHVVAVDEQHAHRAHRS